MIHHGDSSLLVSLSELTGQIDNFGQGVGVRCWMPCLTMIDDALHSAALTFEIESHRLRRWD